MSEPDVETDSAVVKNGGDEPRNRPVDLVPRCGRCGDSHPRDEYARRVKEGKERLKCPCCGHEFVTYTIVTDGGVVVDESADASAPGARTGGDEHGPTKQRVIQLGHVLMASTAGEDGQFLAIAREKDAPDEDSEGYRTLMDVAGYRSVDPFAALDSNPTVTGAGVELDLWEPREREGGR